MKNIQLARETLLLNNLKIVIVNNNEVVYTNDGFGIKPLYIAYMTIKDKMENASCADRVIGKAAAWIYSKAKIKELYCDVITTEAKHILEENNIDVTFAQEVEYIENREKNGMCPVEVLAKDETDFRELLINIKEFLISRNLL